VRINNYAEEKKMATGKKIYRIFVLTDFILLIFFPPLLMAESVKIISFSAPPFMGETKYSSDGVLIELTKELLQASSIESQIEMLPRARANITFGEGKVPLYIGPAKSLNANFREHITQIPLLVVLNVIFYKKNNFPNFSFQQIADLDNYLIGVILGGGNERTIKKNNLIFEPVHSYNSLFKMLDAGRNELVIAPILSAKIAIEEISPYGINNFTYYRDKPFQAVPGSVIINNNLDPSRILIHKINAGLATIYKNGTWLKTMEKYYGKGEVPERSITLIEYYINSNP